MSKKVNDKSKISLHYFTKSSAQTKKLGKILAKRLLKKYSKQKTALVFGLEGELGSGKTTFLQGFAKGLGMREKILSPTFIIMKKFPIPIKTPNLTPKTFIHIDCYRIQKPKEILDLGFKKIVSNPQNIVAIEWADRIRKILPKNSIKIKFEFITKNTRKIIFKVFF